MKIEVAKPATAAATITQSQVAVSRNDWQKREVLRTLLREAEDLKNAIIFCNRKREVAQLAKSLQKHGFAVGALHGDMEQSARLAALDQFRKGELPLLVASDVAARGLDIPAVSHVFNFDIPHHSDDYVHRIGRTGRAGRTGTAISLVSPADQKSIQAVEKLIGQSIAKHESAALDAMPAEDASEAAEAPRSNRRRSGNREANAEGSSRGRRDGRRERDARPEREARPERTPRPEREARAPANESRPPESEAPRERKPRRDRDRRPSEDRGSGPQPAVASYGTSQPPSIGRPQAPRPRREEDFEPGDHSHLPAFLLRPIRARA